MKRNILIAAIVFATILAFIPVTGNTLPGHLATISSCDTYGGHTYCLWVYYDVDCDGWNVTWYGWTSPDGGPYIGGGPIPPIPPSSGAWTQSGVYEDYFYSFTLRLWITFSEYIDLTATETIQEPLPCDTVPTPAPPSSGCYKYKQYYMYTFRDDNQPNTWQKYCYIISENGYPSVEAQARICTVPGFDHTYRATKMIYHGWVVKDCKGHISYGWPAWNPQWFRSSFAK